MKIVDKKNIIGNIEILDIVIIGNYSFMIYFDGDYLKNFGGKGLVNISL